MPTIGQIVNIVLPDAATIRPGIITNVSANDVVDVHVFYDGVNDAIARQYGKPSADPNSTSELLMAVPNDPGTNGQFSARSWH